MSLVNNSANNFKDFLDAIKPYLNYQFYDLSGQGVEANNFSTDEKVIGTWIDGKPLYQKTISGLSIATVWNSQMFAYANVSPLVNDVDNVINACGLGIVPNLNDKTYISSIDIQVKTEEWQLQIVNTYIINTITLKYTKTTDTAVASGEKIVGQWIDGKPVFEKVITGTTPSTQFSSYPIDITSLNLERLVDARVIFDVGPKTYFLDQAHDSNYMLWCMVDTNGTRFNINTAGRGFENLPFSAVIKYTKTS